MLNFLITIQIIDKFTLKLISLTSPDEILFFDVEIERNSVKRCVCSLPKQKLCIIGKYS